MYKAIDAAYYLLKVAKEKSFSITNLQLQKLIYIANGYMLAINHEPLINEQPQAWKYGPVVHSIYRQFKNYSDSPITVNVDAIKQDNLSSDAKEIIDAVVETYGSESAVDLVNLTHAPNTPWDEIWNKQKGCNKLFAEIPNDVIREHFLKAVTDPSSVDGL